MRKQRHYLLWEFSVTAVAIETGPLVIKRKDVLPPDLAKSQIRETGYENDRLPRRPMPGWHCYRLCCLLITSKFVAQECME